MWLVCMTRKLAMEVRDYLVDEETTSGDGWQTRHPSFVAPKADIHLRHQMYNARDIKEHHPCVPF